MYNLEFVIGDVSVQRPGLVFKSGVCVLGLNVSGGERENQNAMTLRMFEDGSF